MLSHGFLIGWALLTTLPLVWAVLSSFKSDEEILTDPWGLPAQLRWENWARAWNEAHIGRYFLNSAIVVAGALVLTMLFGAMAAYVLARYRFRGQPRGLLRVRRRHDVPGLPGAGAAVLRGANLGLLGTLPGLILVYAAYSLPFTVFFLTAFFRTLPTSVAEAAMVDGCGHFRLFFRVMLPMARPGPGQRRHLQLPVPVEPVRAADRADAGRGRGARWVLAQGLTALAVNEGYRGDYSGLFAGMTIAMLPVLIGYLAFHRQVQSGLAAGQLR